MKRLLIALLLIMLAAAQITWAKGAELDTGLALAEQVLLDADARREAILTSDVTIVKGEVFLPGETYTRTAYYVSGTGSDRNSGKTPETPWATLDKVNKAELKAGDAVFFERGCEWYGQLSAKRGVTYSAYGTGAKPVLYGTSIAANDSADWSLLEGTDNIWVYREPLSDCGCIVLDGGEAIGTRVTPWFVDGQWVLASRRKAVFSVAKNLAKNLDFYSATAMFADKATTGTERRKDLGELYLRCDEGNPASIYHDVRLLLWGNTILPANDTVYDNLAVTYCGGHGLYAWGMRVTVQNCEFGWIGGCVHYYADGEEPVRFGNAIESDGTYSVYTVQNNYIHDVYDAGASNQDDGVMENVTYRGNLIEYCNYGIEVFCWTDADDRGKPNLYRSVRIEDNMILMSGYGWGQQRPDKWDAALEGHDARTPTDWYLIRNNVFYLAKTSLITLAHRQGEEPLLIANTYIQASNANMLLRWNTENYLPTPLGRQGSITALKAIDPAAMVIVLDDPPLPRE